MTWLLIARERRQRTPRVATERSSPATQADHSAREGGDGALVYEAGYALVYIGKHSGAARELGIRRRNRDGTGARLGKKNEKDWMDGGGREYT